MTTPKKPECRRVDPRLAISRIAAAQNAMNLAPTAEKTAYWTRIWRARRKVLRQSRSSEERSIFDGEDDL